MLSVLVDSSVLLDLVICCQHRHRRNRSVASSSAAAIEALLFYDEIWLDAPSSFELNDGGTESKRYLDFYCDDSAVAMQQFSGLLKFCNPITVDRERAASIYSSALDYLEKNLLTIKDPDEIGAYELYDFLPYHLGEDPTSVECRVDAYTGSDLNEVLDSVPDYMLPFLTRLENILDAKNHPRRMAWALPMLRLIYYQILQCEENLEFMPHATKSTLGFGRESQTIQTKRFIAYCTEDAQSQFSSRSDQVLGPGSQQFHVPNFSEMILENCLDWDALVETVRRFRESEQLRYFRNRLSDYLGGGNFQDLEELDELTRNVSSSLGKQHQRQIRLAVPFFEPPNCTRKSLVLVHQLFQGT